MAREYYRQSLELNEAFDTVCNYGRSEARSKIYDGAYEKLCLCVYLYPKDKELAAARSKFVSLREEMRLQLDVDEADAIDKRLKIEFEKRNHEVEMAAAPDPGLGDSAGSLYSPWRVPVSAGVAGLGVVGLGVGIGFFVHSGAKKGDAEGLVSTIEADGGHCVEGQGPHEDCGEVQDLRDSSDQAQNIALGSVIAGGSLLVGGILTYFLWPESTVMKTARPIVNYERDLARWTIGLQGEF